MQNINIFFKQNIRKQFCETALGNCYGLKYQNADCSLKNEFIALFITIFGAVSFPIITTSRGQVLRTAGDGGGGPRREL